MSQKGFQEKKIGPAAAGMVIGINTVTRGRPKRS